ncbi:hypothetical protein ACFV84_30475 [Kitasatospora sp. NPDC059811]|uniref:hypothetical protein n=1 Tax=Streptomycetaceae TaxID=2062 RepID=UPI0007AF14B9|nr:hypothetical protein [Streptomyces sp. MJM8645]
MPKLLRPDLYQSVYEAAHAFLQTEDDLVAQCRVAMETGDPLYRYVGYRNFLGQKEQAGRTVWLDLGKDLANRWTGSDLDEGGRQGLYLSAERPSEKNTEFPELTHYQDPEVPPEQQVAYFEYEKGAEPDWVTAKVSELRTMFLFTLDLSSSSKELKGLDLTYPKSEPLLEKILGTARKANPQAFHADDTVEKLYMHPDDASFTRAVGNAALESGSEFFRATSVRDGSSVNVVLSAEPGHPIAVLKPEGRATFFVKSGKSTGVVTIDDMVYNNEFDVDGPGGIPKDIVSADLEPFRERAERMGARLDWSLAEKSVDHAVSTEVRRALKGDPALYTMPAADAVRSVLEAGLSGRMIDALGPYALAATATDQEYPDLAQALGAEGVDTLMRTYAVEPKITQGGYIEAAVRAELLKERTHYFTQKSADIQKEIANAQKETQKTAEELEAQQSELQKTEDKLSRNPDDADLKKAKERLQKEVDELKNRQEEQEKEDGRKEEEKNDADRESTDNGKDLKDAEHRRGEEGKKFFTKGGGA